MMKWDTIGRINISVQNDIVDWLDRRPGRGKWYQKRKGRFVRIVNVLMVMGTTNCGKDNLLPKCLIILAKTECFKSMRLWNIRRLFHRTRFGWGRWHNRIECWGLWEEEQQGGIAVECCMKWQVRNEKLPECIRAHQRRPHVLIISSKNKTDSLHWKPTGIVVCHTDTTLYKGTLLPLT
jgi:hypothetical protein